MAQIKAFKGLLYNSSKVKIENVISPPYDIISEEGRDYFYNLSPYSVIRLILNNSGSPYKEARRILESWIEEKILVFDDAESIYLCRQTFDYRGKSYSRYGFISLLKLEEPGSKILPHEKTYQGPKEDRFNLLKEVETNLSPIFVTFSDKGKKLLNIFKEIEKTEAVFNFDFENITYSFWKIIDKDVIGQFENTMSGKYILIADGHHRYESALNYRNIKRKENPAKKEEEYDYVMSFFAPIEQEGLLILPTHRIINLKGGYNGVAEKLAEYFEVAEYDSKEKLFNELSLQNCPSFGSCLRGRLYLLKIKETVRNEFQKDNEPLSKLDVSVLHKLIFNDILEYHGVVCYTQDEDEVIKQVQEDESLAAFFMRAASMEQIVDVAEKKLLMPQKSTYFYPKIPTGLVFHKFN